MCCGTTAALGSSVRRADLHLLSHDDDVAASAEAPCRTVGCSSSAADRLGFCPFCRGTYDDRAARRWWFVESVAARLLARGDPLFTAFGGRSGAFGAHVAGHLEVLRGGRLHVPRAAVEDYIAEIDEQVRCSA